MQPPDPGPLTPTGSRVKDASAGTAMAMRFLKSAAALAVARMVYDQARKPENQAKVRAAVEKARESARSRRR